MSEEEAPRTTLEDAWNEAEAALPKGWHLVLRTAHRGYIATAAGLGATSRQATAGTPTEALHLLAERLRRVSR